MLRLMSGAGSASLEGGHAHEAWRECAQCGLITALPPPRVGFVAYCPRCNYALRRTARSGFHFSIACGMAAMLFYAVALVAPFLEISVYGRIQLARILTGPIQLTDQGFRFVGLLVLAVTIIFPGIKLGIFLVTLIGLETRTIPAGLLKRLFRWYRPISPWAMIDVYLLGFLVAYTRLTVIAEVHLDTALFSLICFMISAAAADGSLDDEEVWEKLDNAPPRAAAPVTAQNLIGCHGCGLLNQAAPGTRCRRCHTVLRARKEESINQSWALMGAAVLLYIPANIYPVMVITQIAREQPFTIMGGISELLAYGLWPLALLVFFASMMIPLVKLLILGGLLVQTQRGSTMHLLARTRAFRFIDFIGRWSMIDVFMISILVALVRFEQFTNVRAEPGVSFFAGVVVLTMLAVNSFDPRLMWDAHAGNAAAKHVSLPA